MFHPYFQTMGVNVTLFYMCRIISYIPSKQGLHFSHFCAVLHSDCTTPLLQTCSANWSIAELQCITVGNAAPPPLVVIYELQCRTALQNCIAKLHCKTALQYCIAILQHKHLCSSEQAIPLNGRNRRFKKETTNCLSTTLKLQLYVWFFCYSNEWLLSGEPSW